MQALERIQLPIDRTVCILHEFLQLITVLEAYLDLRKEVSIEVNVEVLMRLVEVPLEFPE